MTHKQRIWFLHTSRKYVATSCRWSLSLKPEPKQLHGRKVLSWTKVLTPRLEKKLLQLNIFHLIGLINEYTIVWLSNLVSVGKHAFTDKLQKNEVH